METIGSHSWTRPNDESAVTSAEAEYDQAERDIRRQTERLRVLQEVENDARRDAGWAVKHAVEAERLRAREEASQWAIEADARIAAALAELLGEAWALRGELALLHSPLTLPTSPYHDLLTV